MNVQRSFFFICISGLASFLSAQDPGSIQGLVGVTFFNEGSISFSQNSVLQNEVEGDGDLPTLFTVGAAGFYPMGNAESATSLGLEFGGVFGFGGQVDSYAFVNGNGVVRVDTDLFLADLFLGFYVDRDLGERARIYLSAGGQLLWASLESDYDEDNGLGDRLRYTLTDTGFGAGGYVRAGLEFNYRNEGTFGVGVRAAAGSIGFGGDTGDVDLEPLQVFITYTQPF